jgi:septal ring factor EnvC (AmiA/AmiB activator)
MKHCNLEEELSYALKENNVLQSERDNFKNLYSNLKTSYKDKINKLQNQLEIIEGTFQNKAINFEITLKEKDKKYDDLNTLYSLLMDEIETLKNNKVSLFKQKLISLHTF